MRTFGKYALLMTNRVTVSRKTLGFGIVILGVIGLGGGGPCALSLTWGCTFGLGGRGPRISSKSGGVVVILGWFRWWFIFLQFRMRHYQ